MAEFINMLENELATAFEAAGYDPAFARCSPSNRPDLCEYQCNGAMAAAKTYHKAPLAIAEEVAAKLDTSGNGVFAKAEAVAPGFLNLDVTGAFVASQAGRVINDPHLAIPQETPQKIMIDYGGPNVAKPLHVGHLRSAVIGESIKRIARAVGHDVTGDVHLGDFGLQMGLLITEIGERYPDLPYFNESCVTDIPKDVPFTINDLEEMYPAASARAKEDEAYKERAMAATHALQEGLPGYKALWDKIMEMSIEDLTRNYERLNVHFELWKGESDVQGYIPDMVADLKERGIAHEDDGALIVDVAEETDKKEIPPCIILKSDGASLYATTDLATLVEREKLFSPDRIIYVVDKRQDMHFVQVFRTARKAGIVPPSMALDFLGFGTMNGKDGKPYKTREGGVMRLSSLLEEIEEEMEKKIRSNRNVREEDAKETARIVGLSALKYGDLSNQATKDYIFDIDKFTSFEGNTGPYILYTIVRIKSILQKAGDDVPQEGDIAATLPCNAEGTMKKLMRDLCMFGDAVYEAYEELAPHKLCQYLYELSNDFNSFYHDTKILSEENQDVRVGYLSILVLARTILERGIDLLGFAAPDHM